MNFKFVIIILVFVCVSTSYSQGLLFDPLTANVFEPRAGSMYQFNDDRLRLDIGTSLDLMQLTMEEHRFSVGGDFFTFTRLRSEGKMKFPVETADYFFGVNGAWLFENENIIYSSRLRISHISSHIVDGYTVNNIFIKDPFVYSREFIDMTLAAEYNKFRFYFGSVLIFSTQPDIVNKFVPSVGFDADIDLNDYLSWSSGIDIKYSGTKNRSSHMLALQSGIKLFALKNTAVSLNYYYYDGLSIHGMFFEDKDSYHAIGFQIHYY